MAIRTPEDIDFSTFPASDGQPMAETFANVIQMVDLEWALQTLFGQQGRAMTTAVGGNQFVYYNPFNGRDNISPDVYVAFDVPPPAPPKWQVWVQGKFPDIVWEITSESTHKEDIGRKRALYARLGAREYYIYDPQQETEPWFQGFESREGRMEPLSLLPSGGIMSQLLGAELRPAPMGETERRPAGIWLRVIDPRTGEPVPIAVEEHDDLRVVQDRMALEERLRVSLEERLSLEAQLRMELQGQLAVGARLRAEVEERADLAGRISVMAQERADLAGRISAAAERRADLEGQTRVAAEERADAQKRARIDAEERAARAEAALQALLADQARRQDDGPAPE